jgi:hypothetical protein
LKGFRVIVSTFQIEALKWGDKQFDSKIGARYYLRGVRLHLKPSKAGCEYLVLMNTVNSEK